MKQTDWFDNVTVLGEMMPEAVIAKLRELDDEDTAARLERAIEDGDIVPTQFEGAKGFWSFLDKPWRHTAHAFGYIPLLQPGQTEMLPIQHAGTIQADENLKNSRVKVTLDRLRAADYPGRGTHHILFDFYAQNQLPGNLEDLHFNLACEVREGQHMAVINLPIFVGLNVGSEGMTFKCVVVNVKNKHDEAFLELLQSEQFEKGLQLLATVQPAVKPLSGIALGMTKAIAERNRNQMVQKFSMGLDFSTIATGARLAEGSYVVVQIPESMYTVWDWEQWAYNPANGHIVRCRYEKQLIAYNYIVFSISRYEGE